jgi:hypothetical protein
VDILVPRPIAPLSTARVTSHRPVFHWALAGSDDGAAVDICADRACTNVVTTFSSRGTSGAPTEDLAPGVYFWRLHGTEGSLTGPTTSAVWEFTVPHRSTPVNTSWGTTLDVNGDGFADAVAGGTALNAGAVQVYVGGPMGLSTMPALVTDGVAGGIGTQVASAGDVNGDGFGDLIVGAANTVVNHIEPAGDFWIYYGSATGLSATPSVWETPKMSTLEFGTDPASAGDVNGDGYGDVMVSGYEFPDASIYIYLGSPSGPSGSPLILTGGSLYVSSTATDINGDGFSDVVLTVNDASYGASSGAVHVYYGTATGLSANPVVLSFTGGTAMAGFFMDVESAGDVNGDGFGDVLVYLPQVGKGRVDLYLGSAAGLSQTPIVIPNRAGAGMFFGLPAGVGDINGDGFDDAVFGVGGTPAGVAYVYLGGASGLPTSPTVTVMPPAGVVGNFGEAVGGEGDIDGDGFDDVLIGAPAYEAVGTVYVYPGGAKGLSANPASFPLMFEYLE